MAEEIPFRFEMPFMAFRKADAEPGKQRRIGGIASLETKDRQGEKILAAGLDFKDFLANGWFNDNHSKKTTDVLGYPEKAKLFKKGDVLPNGQVAPANGYWVEGYLLDTKKADETWELAQSLAKTKRRLGFSVEGKIQRRDGVDNKIIAQALVRNVAITNCPVNAEARMDVLAKSLQVVQDADPDELERALTMGTPAGPNPPSGPQTGANAGQVLTPESLERKGSPRKAFGPLDEDEDEDLKKKKKKKLSKSDAVRWVRARLPNANRNQVERFLRLAQAHARRR